MLTRLTPGTSNSWEQIVVSSSAAIRVVDPVFLDEWTSDHIDNATPQHVRAKLANYEGAFNVMGQGVVMMDENQKLIFSNPSYAQLYGFKPEQIRPGMHASEIVLMRINKGVYGEGDPDAYLQERTAPVVKDSDQLQELSDGRTIMVRRRLIAGGGYVATHIDHSARIRLEAEILHMAKHDALTGLVNRFEFHNQAKAILARVRRGEMMAMLSIDLDKFKLINDVHGHAAGDIVLQYVANQLTEETRETDTVARLGGDEFSVLQVGIKSASDAAALAHRLIERLNVPHAIDDFIFEIGASIGITLATPENSDLEELIQQSDVAMYQAKASGRGSACFFDPKMNAAMAHRRDLEKAMRHAIVKEQFEVYYQPIMNVAEKRVTSMEALLRWNHPERGLVSPMEFIPIAEETGLIVPIGQWVLNKACEHAMRWPDDISVAVNVSAIQFRSSDLVKTVRSALEKSGLPPRRLQIEITESVLITNINEAEKALFEFSKMGIKLSLDDFGIGYSSLSYLSNFPFDKIKLDRSFMKDLPNQRKSLAVLRAIAGLGHSLNIATTAEGIETPLQLDLAKKEGCTEVQGYFFSPPRPMSETSELIRSCERKARGSLEKAACI